MNARPYSLVRRLSLQLAWQTALGLGLLCAGVFEVTRWSFQDKQQSHLQSKAGSIRDLGTALARTQAADWPQQLAAAMPRRAGTYLEVVAPTGATLYRDPGPAIGAGEWVEFELALPGGTQQARLWLDTAEDERMLRRLAAILLAASLLGGLLAGGAIAARVRSTLRPLRELAEQTRRITPERLDQRLALAAPVAELQPWVEQFNAMLARLESAYVQLEAFNADVAHELRTPLAALMGHAEVTLARDRGNAELRDALAASLEELQRLSGLVNDMLFLSHADRGARARRAAAASLAALAQQVLEFHEAPLAEAGLRVAVQGDVTVAVDAALFKRALSNLLSNATRYAAPGSEVLVRLERDGQGQVQVWVENAGPDIAPAHLERLFDRFFRADTARSDGESHHGLGLAIVAAIARMHAGRPLAASGAGRTRIGFVVGAG